MEAEKIWHPPSPIAWESSPRSATRWITCLPGSVSAWVCQPPRNTDPHRHGPLSSGRRARHHVPVAGPGPGVAGRIVPLPRSAGCFQCLHHAGPEFADGVLLDSTGRLPKGNPSVDRPIPVTLAAARVGPGRRQGRARAAMAKPPTDRFSSGTNRCIRKALASPRCRTRTSRAPRTPGRPNNC